MKRVALSSDDCQELSELIRLTRHYSARLNEFALKLAIKNPVAISLRYARSRFSEGAANVQAALEFNTEKE